MFKLRENDWVTLRAGEAGEDGVRARFLPNSRGLRRRAKAAALAKIGGRVEDPDALTLAELGDHYSRELIRIGLVELTGIAVGDSDEPMDLTPSLDIRTRTAADADRPTGTIDLFLADEDMLEAAEAAFSMPIINREAEKNALSASPSGTGEAGTRAPDIAGSSATPKPKAGAKAASTGSSSRRRSKAKASGAS